MTLTRTIDYSHAATPNFLQNLIIAESPLGVADIHLLQHRVQQIINAAAMLGIPCAPLTEAVG